MVFAKLKSENETKAFIVDKNTAGLKFGKAHEKLGLTCVPATDIIFDGCKVPNENILAELPTFEKFSNVYL